MKLKIEKQHALKGLLLLALVANMSWRPAMRSLNLSSETVSGTPSAPSAPAVAPAPAPVNADAVTTSDKGPKPDAAAKPSGVSSPAVAATVDAPEKAQRVDTPKICGQRFYITFTEVTLGADRMTGIKIKPLTGVISGFAPITYRANGGFETNVDNADVKKDNDDRIKNLVRARLGRCPEEPQLTYTPERPEESVSKEDKAALKLAIKECRKNSKGDSLTEIERTRCQLRRLSDVDVDSDKRGSQAHALAQIEKLVNGDIRKSIKNRLMSKDDAKVDEGEELLTEAIDTIKDLGSDLNLDPSRMSRIAMSLESLRAGGETYRRSTAMEDDVRQARADFHDQLLLAQQDLRMNPRDPYAIQRMSQIQRDAMVREQQLQSQAQMDITGGPYATLMASMRMGNISSTEFGQFTQPYQLLQRDMLSLLDTRSIMQGDLGGSQFNPSMGALGSQAPLALPTDFTSYRAGLNSNFQRNYGVGVPQQPAPLMLNSSPNWTVNNASTFNNGLYAAPTNYRRFKLI